MESAFRLIKRVKGTISGKGNQIPDNKIILLDGQAKFIDSKETKIVRGPCTVIFQTQDHTIEALSDIIFIENRRP